jgi:hypothetical protein
MRNRFAAKLFRNEAYMKNKFAWGENALCKFI